MARRKSSKKRRFQAEKLMKRMKKSKASQRSSRSVINVEKIGDIPVWQPGDGEHTVAIIPYFAGDNDPNVKEGEDTYLFPYAVHRGVGATEELVICPAATFGKKCPICEHRMKLREEGADKEVWKKLFPRDRAIYNIVVYDDRKEAKVGVRLWDVSQFYFEQPVVKIATRKKGVVFQDPDDGKNIVFEIEPAKSRDDYPSYTAFQFEDRDDAISDEVLEQAVQIDQVVNVLSYKEIKDLYWAGKVEDRDDDEDDDDYDDDEEEERRPRDDEEEPEHDLEEMIEELDDCEDTEELEEFADEYGFRIDKVKPYKPRAIKKELRKMIHERVEPDEEEDDDAGSDYAWGDIKKMSKVKLKRLIKNENLDLDASEADDLEELREMVAEELDIVY